MTQQTFTATVSTRTPTDRILRFDLGTFEGFNFRGQSAIDRVLTAQEVVDWDHDLWGEAEFWPAGDRPEVRLVFGGSSSVTGSELLALDRALQELGDDSPREFLRIHYVANVSGGDLANLTRDELEDADLHLFFGTSFIDLRREAAYELFELYWPEAYKVWDSHTCDGLIFDVERFLRSPGWMVEEVTLGDQVALILASW